MLSPFPGMDPYLERSWRDVHTQLITSAQAALNGTLPEDLIARVEERVVVVLEFESEEHTDAFMTILDVHGNELVTVVEFLSPTNKLPGPSRDQYRRKRDELFASKVNVVEVDLVRAGRWRELLASAVAPAREETCYRVITRRMHPKPRVELYPISLRLPLPVIPVPLRRQELDVVLNLQPLIDQAYRNGRYDRTRYDGPCDPPLENGDAAWAEAQLQVANRGN